MAGVDVDRVIRRVEREAVKQSLDLDDVREVDGDVDADGIVVRALETDAPSEEDQVGIQLHCPPGQNGYRMFDSNVGAQIRELKEYVSGDDDGETDDDNAAEDGTDPAETDQGVATDESETSQSGQSQQTVQTVENTAVGLALNVALDDDSLDDLRNEHEDLLEEFDDLTVDEARVAELEADVADLEYRLSRIEENLSMLSLGDD